MSRKENYISQIKSFLQPLGIEINMFNKPELKQFKSKWISAFSNEPRAEVFTYKGEFLWHIFSCNYAECKEKDNAKAAYDSVKKQNAIIYIQDIDSAFYAENISQFNSAQIEELCKSVTDWMDIIVTSDVFSWTYCRTHEVGSYGPYYCEKN